MHAVDPHVHEVAALERPVREVAMLVLPLGREAGDNRRGQACRRTEEPFQRGREVAAGHARQIHERQHLGHLRGLATPRRHQRALELEPLTGLAINSLVVHARRLDVDAPRAGCDRPRPGVPVADHQTIPVLVERIRQALDVRVDLRLERSREHPTRALPTDLIQPRRQLRARGLVSNYLQHRRSFLAGIRVPALLVGQAGRYAAPSNRPAIHNFGLYLPPCVRSRTSRQRSRTGRHRGITRLRLPRPSLLRSRRRPGRSATARRASGWSSGTRAQPAGGHSRSDLRVLDTPIARAATRFIYRDGPPRFHRRDRRTHGPCLATAIWESSDARSVQ